MKTKHDYKWNPDGCTLLPCVRDLIQMAYLATRGKGNVDYQPVWCPDLPLGPARMTVAHDCRKVPRNLLGAGVRPAFSMGQMQVFGDTFVMSETPPAAHHVYIGACHNCKSVYFASAWDRDDTVENYVKKLKAG